MGIRGISGPATSYYSKFAEIADVAIQTGVLDRIAGETIQGHSVVVSGTDGLIYKVDNTDVSNYGRVLGITDKAYIVSSLMDVISSGVVSDPSFNFNPGSPLFFNSTGQITETPPTTGFLQNIGHAIDATHIIIELKTPIQLT